MYPRTTPIVSRPLHWIIFRICPIFTLFLCSSCSTITQADHRILPPTTTTISHPEWVQRILEHFLPTRTSAIEVHTTRLSPTVATLYTLTEGNEKLGYIVLSDQGDLKEFGIGPDLLFDAATSERPQYVHPLNAVHFLPERADAWTDVPLPPELPLTHDVASSIACPHRFSSVPTNTTPLHQAQWTPVDPLQHLGWLDTTGMPLATDGHLALSYSAAQPLVYQAYEQQPDDPHAPVVPYGISGYVQWERSDSCTFIGLASPDTATTTRYVPLPVLNFLGRFHSFHL